MKKIFFILFCIFIPLLKGCAFFNTYFNARKALNNGIASLQRAAEQQSAQAQPDQGRRPDRFDIVYDQATDEAKNFFTLAIEKGNKIVVLYPDSRWVEDAILLLGKAHFLRGTGNDYYDARNRFEVFFLKYPESSKSAEAYLWYARTLEKLHALDQAVAALRKALELKPSPDIAAEVHGLLGIYAYNERRLNDAISEFRRSDSLARNQRLRKQAAYRLAYTLIDNGQYASATTSLKKILKMELSIPERFLIHQIAAHSLKKQKQFTEALRLMDRLLGDFRMKNYFPYIESEIADILIHEGRIKEAEKQLIYIINTYRQPQVSGDAYYRLAMIADTIHHQPQAAMQYLQIIKSKYPQSSFFAEAEQHLNHLSRIEYFHQSIHFEQELLRWLDTLILRPDSLRLSISADLSEIADTSSYIINTDSLSEEHGSGLKAVMDTINLDSLQWLQELESSETTAGSELFMSQEDLSNTQKQITDTSKIRDVYRKDMAEIIAENKSLKDRLQFIRQEKSRLRQVSGSVDSLKNNRLLIEERLASLYHELAAYYQNTGIQSDSALFYYGMVIEKFPRSNLAEEAMYARAGIYEKIRPALFLTELRNAYRAFPDGRFVFIYHQIMKSDEMADDTTALYFRRAETALFEENWRQALDNYRSIVRRDTGTNRRRALYMMGLIYQRTDQNDSAFIMLNTLNIAYPADPLAQKVSPKLRQFIARRNISSDSLIWYADTTIAKVNYSRYLKNYTDSACSDSSINTDNQSLNRENTQDKNKNLRNRQDDSEKKQPAKDILKEEEESPLKEEE